MKSFLWNSGCLSQKNYESDYNAFRRFFIANSGVSDRHFKAHLGRLPSKEDIIDIIKKTQCQSYWKNNKWLYVENWKSVGDGYRRKITQCPACADELFHCHFYQTLWCTKCPIHGIQLSIHCPTCGAEWPLFNELRRRKCRTCGTLTSALPEHVELQNKDHSSEQEGRLINLWDLQSYNQQLDVLYHDFMYYGTNPGILITSPLFPSLFVRKLPPSKQVVMECSDSTQSLSSKKFSIELLPHDALDLPVERESQQLAVMEMLKMIVSQLHMFFGQVTALDLSKEASLTEYSYGMPIPRRMAYLFFHYLSALLQYGNSPPDYVKSFFNRLLCEPPRLPSTVNAVFDPSREAFYSVEPEFKLLFMELEIKHQFLVLMDITKDYVEIEKMEPVRYYAQNLFTTCHKYISSQYSAFALEATCNNEMEIIYLEYPTWDQIFMAITKDEKLPMPFVDCTFDQSMTLHYQGKLDYISLQKGPTVEMIINNSKLSRATMIFQE